VRGSIRAHAVLRDQFVASTGPPPDDHPASLVVSASREFLQALIPSPVESFIELMHQTARRFEATFGYLTADRAGSGMQSPYERRHDIIGLRHPRLDAHTRGIHWGNLIGPGHLAAIGGLPVLQSAAAGEHSRPCGDPQSPCGGSNSPTTPTALTASSQTSWPSSSGPSPQAHPPRSRTHSAVLARIPGRTVRSLVRGARDRARSPQLEVP
jgi:hypothetical protein